MLDIILIIILLFFLGLVLYATLNPCRRNHNFKAVYNVVIYPADLGIKQYDFTGPIEGLIELTKTQQKQEKEYLYHICVDCGKIVKRN